MIKLTSHETLFLTRVNSKNDDKAGQRAAIVYKDIALDVAFNTVQINPNLVVLRDRL